MDQLALTFFPFPCVFRGERRDGAVYPWPNRCLQCRDRQCEEAVEEGLRLCSHGVNYQRVDADLLVAGIVVSDYPGPQTPARSKVLREVRKQVITRDQLAKTLAKGAQATSELEQELKIRMDAVVEEYRASKSYEREVLELLRPDLEQTLGQVHDYKQFVQQIVQNIDVFLEAQCPGQPVEVKIERAEHEIAAIYWAARLMDEKLDAALYLLYPDRIHELHSRATFRMHGLITKYRKIYKSQIDAKCLQLCLEGTSWGYVEGNGRALSIIPHTFIDNAVKYAPHGSTITLVFDEADNELKFSVISFGPRILPGEQEKIFELFYRGEEARRLNSEGTGFGLASAHNIARALSLPMTVTQDGAKVGPDNTRLTTASVRFALLPQDERRQGRFNGRVGR